MNHRRPGPVLLVVAALASGVGRVAVAQDEAPPTTPPEGPSPSELYRDVTVLGLVNRLELTTAQIEKIVPVVERVADQAAADEKADAAAYETVKPAADRLIAALLAGMAPMDADMALLDQAATERTQREDSRAALAADAAVQIQRVLTAEQARRIETASRQAQRKAQQAQMGGAETPLEYIVRRLDEQAELMPDEYVRTREDRAVETAQVILGEGAAGVRALAGALLGIMDEVEQWSAQQYAARRPTLAEEIAKELNLPQEPDTSLIKYEDFIAWITSERTAPVLRDLLAARKAAEKEGEQ
ncbi:MAG: hypothetical protein FJX75_12440 [Armatimonadetes bacterium]|nr:hypothetical protein [Armatimonadota bacterium]